MATIKEDETFTQVVRFDVEPDKQLALIAAIVEEVERWVCHRPGFISSTFHASHDGRNVINYAQWEDETAFKGFTQDPETERLQAAIRSVDSRLKPHAVHCRVVRSIDQPV
ncbi:antibiotic biosynthesis monooxygenase [Burkholderia sp. S171]|jgi:C-6 monooxygenase|uniref:antibiotic biosynthesis monooxygenase family protein n=1 Tax=Burkholderia sp. S171 TaxID=1641860 RepID=UPI00131C4AE1|nr:antibiotic biosynthesis monooxygenase [Burkholderia sp. S171]